jgi:alkylation response protein AidB-like acyl-CoA dehydrogenase
MKEQYYSRRNLNFMLYELLDVLSLTKEPYFAAHDAVSFDMVLDTAESIAEKNMRPFLKETDRQQPELINGQVKVHKAIAEYYKAFCDSGLMAASFDEQFGGQQLPKTVYAAADFIVGNAHNGFEMFTSLSNGAARLLISFASPGLVNEFVVKILSGEYTATMCLTETQAGSSLSDIATEALPQRKGDYKSDSYRIKGQKIFISAGDHDITENIIHLVLARVKDAPKGVKGISLFIVPKKRMEDNGKLIYNDVSSIGIYHKMGQHSTPAMHLEFGAANDCIGYLIGEEGKGLFYMFQMMNNARLGVGLAGTYIASAAYYASLQYAKERPQGRRLNNKNLNEPPTTIIHHPDVRRMLFLQKVVVEGSLALILQCYKYIDLEKISSGDEQQRYNDLLELLTPVAKTYGAEMGNVSVNNGMQVLGGYGYTEDFILEQLARDVRIMSLYEGTTGIQSQALLGRQVPMNNGRSLQYWKEEVMKDIDAGQQVNNLQQYADWLLNEIEELETVTKHLLAIASKGDAEIFLSDATLYMEVFGLVNIAWQWLKQAVVANNCLNEKDSTVDNENFYRSKIETMQFFFHYELVKTKGLCARLKDEKVLTIWKEDEMIL